MEILQFIPDIKGRKCPIHSIKAWFLTTDYDTNTGRIEFSCMPNASCRVNYLPTSFSMPLSSVLLDSIETQASSFQISSCCFAPKINNNKTDSQYFHPTWPQKVFLEMYLQPNQRTEHPPKKHSSTSQGTGFKSAFRPQWHMGFRAATAPTWRTMWKGCHPNQVEATRCIRFGGVKEGDLKISTWNAFFNSYWEG